MARQFREVWDALDISYDEFIQTSEPRHHACCRKFIQKVYDNGHIYKGSYEGWYCDGCEAFKSGQGATPRTAAVPEPQDAARAPQRAVLLLRAVEVPGSAARSSTRRTPTSSSRRAAATRCVGFVEAEGCRTSTSRRTGQKWGIRVPFDPEFTIYVWFDALLTYITGIGYGDDERTVRRMVAVRHALHRQGHHAVSLRPVAGDAAWRPAWTRREGVRPRLRLRKTKRPARWKDQQDARQRRSSRWTSSRSSASMRSATTSCASARSPATASLAGSDSAKCYNSELANNLGNLYQPVRDTDHEELRWRAGSNGWLDSKHQYRRA